MTLKKIAFLQNSWGKIPHKTWAFRPWQVHSCFTHFLILLFKKDANFRVFYTFLFPVMLRHSSNVHSACQRVKATYQSTFFPVKVCIQMFNDLLCMGQFHQPIDVKHKCAVSIKEFDAISFTKKTVSNFIGKHN